MKYQNKNIVFILYLSATYLLILAFRGFEFASGDMVEVLNYAKHMIQPDIFNNDFYIRHISEVIPNERIVFSSFLKFLISNCDCLLYIVHFGFTILMLVGLFRISSVFISQNVFRWLTILILFGPLYKINLGGNELYYNMLISSFVAKVFGVWAVYYFLKSKKALSIFLILIATIIHPTVGSQLFIIIALSMGFDFVKKGKEYFSSIDLVSLGLYVVLAGGYIFMLLSKVRDFAIGSNLYFEIFEFRVPHHFFPQYFPLKSYVIELTLFVIGMFAMVKFKLNELFKFSIIILFGIIVYLIGVYVLKIPFILNTQWFKSTIWLELFSLIGLMAYIDNKVKLPVKQEYAFLTLLLSFSLFVWALIVTGNSYFAQKPYQFSENMDLNEEEELGVLVKSLTQKDDVFIWPIDFSGFKYYSNRGAYVDYKSVVHRGTVLKEWYRRIKMIYGIDINTRRDKKNVQEVARNNYKKMDKKVIEMFKENGIDYIVQYAGVDLDLPVIAGNDKYIVYKVH